MVGGEEVVLLTLIPDTEQQVCTQFNYKIHHVLPTASARTFILSFILKRKLGVKIK